MTRVTELYELVAVVMTLWVRLGSTMVVREEPSATFVEWWGDERAEFGPQRAFIDLIIDDEMGEAVEDYALLGSLVSSAVVKHSADCIIACHRNEQCASANFYHPGSLKSDENAGLCELLREDQATNPTWMKPFPRSTHYSNLRCQKGGVGARLSSRRAESYFLKSLLAKLEAKRAGLDWRS